MRQPTAHRIREKATGKVFWVEHRIGYTGHEFNAGGGWRKSITGALTAARNSGSLTEAAA